LNYLDLFSGIGGFALGAYNAGWRFDRHYFSEIDPWCCRLYARRFPDAVPLGDIREIDGLSEGEWFLTGGFPCQDLSYAGRGEGIEGERSGLWFHFARLVDDLRPRYVVVENVPALRTRGMGRVLGDLARSGYDCQWNSIRASDVGAPHKRERVFVVAYPAGQRQPTPWKHFQSFYPEEEIYREADQLVDAFHRRRMPFVCGRHDGIPDEMDGLKGLGNSIVPQIAEMIFRGLSG
jgi:DNA (cytosine-5)-methyltransferase 1